MSAGEDEDCYMCEGEHGARAYENEYITYEDEVEHGAHTEESAESACAAFDRRAISECSTESESPIHGVGSMATIPLRRGTIIEINQQPHQINCASDRQTQTWIPVIAGNRILGLNVQINHSCSPNCRVIRTPTNYSVQTIRNVKLGEELTVNYSHHGRIWVPFQCTCKAKACAQEVGETAKDSRAADQWHLMNTGRQIHKMKEVTIPEGSRTLPLIRRRKRGDGAVKQSLEEDWKQVWETEQGEVTKEAYICLLGSSDTESEDDDGATSSKQNAQQNSASHCLRTNVANQWLYLWARDNGWGYHDTIGEGGGGEIWIAHTYLSQLIYDQNGEYNARKLMSDTTAQWLTSRKQTGTYQREALVIPVYVPPATRSGIGHWYWICIRPNQRRIDWSDSLGGGERKMTSIIARWWDDICERAMGYNMNAQSWETRQVNLGRQTNGVDCGFFMLAGISSITADRWDETTEVDKVTPADISHIKQIIASDLMEGGVGIVGMAVCRARGKKTGDRTRRRAAATKTNVAVALAQRRQTLHKQWKERMTDRRNNTPLPPCWGNPDHEPQEGQDKRNTEDANTPKQAQQEPLKHQTPAHSPEGRIGTNAWKNFRQEEEAMYSSTRMRETSVGEKKQRKEPTHSKRGPNCDGGSTSRRWCPLGHKMPDKWWRISQWQSDGTRRRTIHGKHRVKVKHAMSQVENEPRQPYDGITESKEGRQLVICSVNLGTAGIRGCLRDICEWLEEHTPAILHLQEIRIRSTDVKKVRAALQKGAPHYALYTHTCHAEGKRNTAVATLIRRELGTHVQPLDVKTPKSALRGRILALKYSPPNQQPVAMANIWMPHSGYPAEEIKDAYEDISTLMQNWRQAGMEVVVMGDWNATATNAQRWRNNTREVSTKSADMAFRDLIDRGGWKRETTLNGWTWETPTGDARATLDHVLTSKTKMVEQGQLLDDWDCVTDHKMMQIQLKECFGRWIPMREGQHSYLERIDLPEDEEKADLFTQAMLPLEGNYTLEEVETRMWTEAERVFGLQKKPTGRKPLQTATMRKLKEEIREMHRMIRMEEDVDTILRQTRWQTLGQWSDLIRGDLVNSVVDMTQEQLRVKVRQRMSEAKQEARRYRNKLMQENLQRCIQTKRENLGKRKRAVQTAMGKGTARETITKLETTHPDTMVVTWNTGDPHTQETWQRQCADMDAILTHKRQGSTDCYTVATKTDMAALINEWTKQDRGDAQISLTCVHHIVTTDSDILSAEEHHMGEEGRARNIVCARCMGENTLTTLSSVRMHTREIVTYCKVCQQNVDTCKKNTVYDNTPWTDETKYRTVPTDTGFTLRGEITMDELKRTIKIAARGKAPGENRVPMELWKWAPDWALTILLTQVNTSLQTGKMPPAWKGGVVQMLFKKHPTCKISNWRPVCMTNVSYRILAMIVAQRLKHMAEYTGLLEHTQEGFRPKHGTKRQIERLLNTLHMAKTLKKRIILAYIDFKNAFNSIDIEAAMRILEAFNVPDVDVLRNMYEGAYYIVRGPNGTTTAPIPLTRGTKQGDPASPVIFNIVINMLLRMIATHGKAVDLGGIIDKLVNCAGFADDTALITESEIDMNSTLNGPLLKFCRWSGMQVNVSKSMVTGINYATNKPVDTSMIHFDNIPLEQLKIEEAYKYLGVHIRADLRWKDEKRYVQEKVRKAIDELKHTCYTRGQITWLWQVCVLPLFRYSAALVPWTNKEMMTFDKQWTSVIKASLRLPPSFDTAPLMLTADKGGMDCTQTKSLVIQELRRHIQQCLLLDDEVCALTLALARDIRRRCGIWSDVGTDWLKTSKWMRKEAASSTIWRLQMLMPSKVQIKIQGTEAQKPEGILIAEVYQEETSSKEREHRMSERAWRQRQKQGNIERLIMSLHAQGIYAVGDLLSEEGWGLQTYDSLPHAITRHHSKDTYSILAQHLERHPVANRHITAGKPTWKQYEQKVSTGSQKDMDEIAQKCWGPGTKAFADLEEFEWKHEDAPIEDVGSIFGTEVCKWWTVQGKRLAYFGMVVAFARATTGDDTNLYRIIYSDADAEDLDDIQLEQAIQQFDQTKNSTRLTHGQTVNRQRFEAEEYAKKWWTRATETRKEELDRLDKKWPTGELRLTYDGQQSEDAWKQSGYRIVGAGTEKRKIKHVYTHDAWRADHADKGQRVKVDTKQGMYTVIQETNGQMSEEEQERLLVWWKALTHPTRNNTESNIPRSQDKNSILAYVNRTQTEGKQRQPKEPVFDPPRMVPWSGKNLNSTVSFDWSTMQATTQHDGEWTRIQRGGRTTYWTKEREESGNRKHEFIPGLWKNTKRRQMVKVAEIDSRQEAAILARMHREENSWVGIAEEMKRERGAKRNRNPHSAWLEAIRRCGNAEQFIGGTTEGIPPGFPYVGYLGIGNGIPGVHTKIDWTRSTVIWMDENIDRDRLWHALGQDDLGEMVIIMDRKMREEITPATKWRNIARTLSIPPGALTQREKEVCSLEASTNKKPMEIWTTSGQSKKDWTATLLKTNGIELQQTMQQWRHTFWSNYWEASQDYKYWTTGGTVVATDGSVQPDDNNRGGAAVIFRSPAEGNDISISLDEKCTTLVAEGVAIAAALQAVELDEPLTILTDSANIMFIVQHSSRTEWWKDFMEHTDRNLIRIICEALANRRAHTHWVKVKSHCGVLLNDRADRLAYRAISQGEQREKPIQYTHPRDIKMSMIENKKEIVIDNKYILGTLGIERNAIVTAKQTRTVMKLQQTDVGRHIFAKIVWKHGIRKELTDTAVKRILQALTNTYPVQARLELMRKTDTDICQFCKQERETLGHWQLVCTTFSDARTAAHDHIWGEIFNALTQTVSTKWKLMHEKRVKDTKLRFTQEETGNRKPDGILYNESTRTWLLIDMKRGGGSTRDDLRKHEEAKKLRYEDMMADLHRNNRQDTIIFRPMVCSYNGAIAIDTWKDILDTVLTKDTDKARVLEAGMRAVCTAFSLMVEARYEARRTAGNAE